MYLKNTINKYDNINYSTSTYTSASLPKYVRGFGVSAYEMFEEKRNERKLQRVNTDYIFT